MSDYIVPRGISVDDLTRSIPEYQNGIERKESQI